MSPPTDKPIYLSGLVSDALESLRRIKQDMTTKENLKADMWCHFGKAVVRGPDQGNAQFWLNRYTYNLISHVSPVVLVVRSIR